MTMHDSRVHIGRFGGNALLAELPPEEDAGLLLHLEQVWDARPRQRACRSPATARSA